MSQYNAGARAAVWTGFLTADVETAMEKMSLHPR